MEMQTSSIYSKIEKNNKKIINKKKVIQSVSLKQKQTEKTSKIIGI